MGPWKGKTSISKIPSFDSISVFISQKIEKSFFLAQHGNKLITPSFGWTKGNNPASNSSSDIPRRSFSSANFQMGLPLGDFSLKHNIIIIWYVDENTSNLRSFFFLLNVTLKRKKNKPKTENMKRIIISQLANKIRRQTHADSLPHSARHSVELSGYVCMGCVYVCVGEGGSGSRFSPCFLVTFSLSLSLFCVLISYFCVLLSFFRFFFTFGTNSN